MREPTDEEMFDMYEESYAGIADELNDGNPADLTIDDMDPTSVSEGKKYAESMGLRWPPQMGDYDRYWERKNG